MAIKNFLITSLTNIRYLTGFTGTYAKMLLLGNRKFFFTDARYTEYAKKILPENVKLIDIHTFQDFFKKHRIPSIGIEAENMTLAQFEYLKKMLKNVKFKPMRDVIEKLRQMKTTQEIAYIAKAQRISEKVLETILKKYLRPGVTEKDLAWEIERLGHEFGADTISFPPIIGFGEHSAIPHHQNTDRKFHLGDIVLIDMGMKYRGYCSDMTRTFFTKQPSLIEQKIYSIVLEAQNAGIRATKPGVKGSKIDKISRDVIKKTGYGKSFGHSLGHGIGLDVHEAPYLSVRAKEKLPKGTVVTVEPGIYLPGKFGVRIEDMVHLTGHGAKNLTRFSRDPAYLLQ